MFHETSHGVMDKVMDAIQIAEASLNTHRPNGAFHSVSIWHMVLFYTAGKLVAEQIPGYVPYADKNGLWVRAWPNPDRALIQQDWKLHRNGSLELQQALSKLVDDLPSASSHQMRTLGFKTERSGSSPNRKCALSSASFRRLI
jgi:hypothetical protein